MRARSAGAGLNRVKLMRKLRREAKGRTRVSRCAAVAEMHDAVMPPLSLGHPSIDLLQEIPPESREPPAPCHRAVQSKLHPDLTRTFCCVVSQTSSPSTANPRALSVPVPARQ